MTFRIYYKTRHIEATKVTTTEAEIETKIMNSYNKSSNIPQNIKCDIEIKTVIKTFILFLALKKKKDIVDKKKDIRHKKLICSILTKK